MGVIMNETVIKHLPWKDQDRIRVFGKNLEEGHETETFYEDVQCEQCETVGSFTLDSETTCQIGLCWTHLLCSYDRVEIIEQRRNYVYLWERSMNSGIVELEDRTLEQVKKIMYSDKVCKNTIILGEVVHTSGERN